MTTDQLTKMATCPKTIPHFSTKNNTKKGLNCANWGLFLWAKSRLKPLVASHNNLLYDAILAGQSVSLLQSSFDDGSDHLRGCSFISFAYRHALFWSQNPHFSQWICQIFQRFIFQRYTGKPLFRSFLCTVSKNDILLVLIPSTLTADKRSSATARWCGLAQRDTADGGVVNADRRFTSDADNPFSCVNLRQADLADGSSWPDGPRPE